MHGASQAETGEQNLALISLIIERLDLLSIQSCGSSPEKISVPRNAGLRALNVRHVVFASLASKRHDRKAVCRKFVSSADSYRLVRETERWKRALARRGEATPTIAGHTLIEAARRV